METKAAFAITNFWMKSSSYILLPVHSSSDFCLALNFWNQKSLRAMNNYYLFKKDVGLCHTSL